ncbi:NUDIX hydrolase [Parachlamydia sp. AcF125]|uniref:NUDIX hydrolase n=1 Tax=Parachlamydia sp. AcF125 TaxID=2795736 RepID=UPI001BC9B37E|nr:NUDIX hydrolase [Parachlamydia sp. AcF125]MBS4168948.1 RNA pyrophosphohydrolase [Parachlamydia sp. AcF125]
METIRSAISAIVASIQPFDQEESEHIHFTHGWIESGAYLFRTNKPALPLIHLVSYFVVFDQRNNQILLVDHKKSNLWLPPGGHVEPEEDPKETVKREIKEELGIEADFIFDDPIFLTVTNTANCEDAHTDVSLWYVVKGNSDQPLRYDREEFHQIHWYTLDNIPFECSDLHLQRFIHKFVSYLAK